MHDARHQQFIEERIPDWLTQASPHRRQALRHTKVAIPDWYRAASVASHTALAQAVKARWQSQAKLDRVFESLADIRQFAEPLLRKALKDRFGVELDVINTCLQLYLPEGIVRGYRVKNLSLLDAALHNFENKESQANYFDAASCFISQPDSLGQFNILPVNELISIPAFASMCRELDIGGQYYRQLEEVLLARDAAAKAMLAYRVKTNQKDAFKASVLLAGMKGDIGADSQAMLLQIADGVRSSTLHCHQLQIMAARLTGIVVLAGDVENSTRVEPLLVYIPDDPQHPIKEYSSTLAFRSTLIEQLRSTDYQTFFSRFIDHEQRGAFFAGLDQYLNVVTFHPPQPGDSLPPWRATRVDNPTLRFTMHRVGNDPWQWLYQESLNKILNDARTIAVSTADVDRQSRWALWDSLERVAFIVLQVATLVAMPFVPFLGELMLAYTAYQLLDDTFTGILDWAEGQVTEAAGHLLSVAENLIQVGALGAAGAVAGKVLTIKPSAFVEGLKPVVLDDGRARLWNPDLKPYEQIPAVSVGSELDDLGLLHREGQKLLTLEGRTYEVAEGAESGVFHVRHPRQPNAYRPRLTHNGEGAWAHEVERPMEWQGAQLFRRLGQSVADFSDATAQRILAVSGVDEAMLRHLHVHAGRPPALLGDTIRRFRLDERIRAFRQYVGSSDPLLYAKADVRLQLHLLKAQQVVLSEASLLDGNVIQTVVTTLEEGALKKLLGLSSAFGDSLPSLSRRASLLRNRMEQWALMHREELFEVLEEAFESEADIPAQQMRRVFPQLPRTVAQELWREAGAAERLHLQNRNGMPRRMADEALFYLREVRINRAYEGVYLEAMSSTDSEMVILHTLETLDGWSARVRIEVRDAHFDGALLDSIGHSDASIRKVLVRKGKQYETFDEHGEQLHGLDDLYGAVQHALPRAQREALGLSDVWQGSELEQAVRQQPLLPRSTLRMMFNQPPLEPDLRSPMGLAVGRAGYLLGGGDGIPSAPGTVEQRFKRLFPTLAEDELEALRNERLGANPLPALISLENEYLALVNELELWGADVPARHPQTDLPLSSEESAAQRRNRAAFIEVVKACWGRRLTPENRFDVGRFFSKVDVLGDLPDVSADFSHVSEFLLINSSADLRAASFLKNFQGLESLTMRGVRLEGFPVEVFQMRSLTGLSLENCDLRLTEATAEGIAHMDSLEELDLDNNPLGISPTVVHMKQLERLQLKATGLSEVPFGLFALEKLTFVDLAFNEIVDIPDELFDVPDTRNANYNFSDNPLSDASRQRVSNYYNNASLDKRVLIQVGEDPVEGADEEEAESDSESDESGVESGGDE
ncbi:MAG: dermonecrotic toxin domain-containing protein [Pseudomonas sp.]|uniref:dermonecrotic toxin domain-containing protein n=1 Tax=Pseudomonas sp. TaxID=306 RepID=UPI003D6F0AA4